MIRGISLLVMWMLLVGFSVPADAQVLCTNPSGLVFVRTQCKGNEIQLDPVTLGLVDSTCASAAQGSLPQRLAARRRAAMRGLDMRLASYLNEAYHTPRS